MNKLRCPTRLIQPTQKAARLISNVEAVEKVNNTSIGSKI
jgi:hypothetical protein